LSDSNPYVYGLAFLRGRNEIAIARKDPVMTVLNLDNDGSETQIDFGGGSLWTVARSLAPDGKAYVSSNGVGAPIFLLQPDTKATESFANFPVSYRLLNAAEPPNLVGAGFASIYALTDGSPSDVVRLAQSNGTAAAVQSGGTSWRIDSPTSITVYQPTAEATPTLFVGTGQRKVFMSEDGGSASQTLIPDAGERVTGLAFASPTLYVAVGSLDKIISVNINSSFEITGRLQLTATDPILQYLTNPRGLTLDDAEEYLYIGTNGASKTIIRYPLPLPTPAGPPP
jgi:hypothetical protein